VRSRLVEAGLIEVERGDGCKLKYHLVPQKLTRVKLPDRPSPARKARTSRSTTSSSTPPEYGAVVPSESWSTAIHNTERFPLNHGAPHPFPSNKEGSSKKGLAVDALRSHEEQRFAEGVITGGYIEVVL
jgi:hypothetical protein